MQSAAQTGAPISTVIWAEEFVGRCPGGAALLGHLWSSVPSDTLRLVTLLRSSDAHRVRSLYDSLKAVLGNTGRPLLVREHALVALLGYAAPTVMLNFPLDYLAKIRGTGGSGAMVAFVRPPSATEPSATSARSDLSYIFRWQLAENASTPQDLRDLAVAGLQTMANESPQSFAPGADGLIVTYMCGARFRVINRSRVALPYVFQVGTTAAVKTLRLDRVPLSKQADTLNWDFQLFGPLNIQLAGTLLRTIGVPSQPVACP